MSHKSVPKVLRMLHKSVLERMAQKNDGEESKSASCGIYIEESVSWKSITRVRVPQECPERILYTRSVIQDCRTKAAWKCVDKVYYKMSESVTQECYAKASYKCCAPIYLPSGNCRCMYQMSFVFRGV